MYGMRTRSAIYLGVLALALGSMEVWKVFDPPRRIIAKVTAAETPRPVSIHAPIAKPKDINPVYELSIIEAFGPCGDPCRVRVNLGGEVATYALAAWGFVNGARSGFVIDGPCASACAMAADLAHAVTCITPRAQFWFHLSNEGLEPPQRPEVAAYVHANGGFPSFNSGALTPMDYQTALQFWRPCR